MNNKNKTVYSKSVKIITALIIISVLVLNCSNRQTAVGFLDYENINNQNEIKAAFSFLEKNNSYKSKRINFKDVAEKNDILSHFDLIWFHYPDTIDLPENKTNFKVISAIKDYLNKGGKLLLTQNALILLSELGLEKTEPQAEYVEAKDYGYGRKRGFHAFRSHPVFKELQGGSYIFSPKQDTTVRQVGYFKPQEKIKGKVIAVDWAYIRLEENKRLVLEYDKENSKIIAIGAYMEFAVPNYHQAHFELFVNNVLAYITEKNKKVGYYWEYPENRVTEFSPDPEKTEYQKAISWNKKKAEIFFKKEKATDNSWNMAGRRMVIMGKEKTGIEEIWAHPVMALRDYEIGYRFESDEKIIWLNNLDNNKTSILIEPHAFTRKYSIAGSELTELITVDISNPAGIIHYEYKGGKKINLYLKFKSNLRYMWPYSSHVFSTLNYAWNDTQNSFIIKDGSGDFSCIIGTNKIPSQKLIGRYNSVYFKKNKLMGKPGKTFGIYAMLEFAFNKNDKFDLVISASDQGVKTTQKFYNKTIKAPYSIYQNTHFYYKDLLKNRLSITTPDKNFNDGYKWALVGTDKFFVHTPGIGKSLVAGYATTAHGWNGGHEVNGRPGYAWYFGRDGQWSGFAVADYGDFEKVRDILIQYLDFQDISGKIYHELTTSGVVHYDAADTTPLFIILAGHYLRNSGDINFIRQNWKKIKKAVDYCFSTDTDNDRLIENTNTGHGWVEGGHLFGGKSTLYLSSCWAAALKEASSMAAVISKDSESLIYEKEHAAVVEIINHTFWNSKKHTFNHSINEDGSFISESTVMPAIPLYFKQIRDFNRIQSVLAGIASNNFTSNWGVRIVSEKSEHFHPRGYHTGSVWPLFTGWAALAEYKNYKPVQGFSHIMNNLLIYKDWASGYIEEVLNGAVYKPSGVCSHQCWSETMILQPVIEGMLGLYPSAPENKLSFSPVLPFQWNNFSVENIRIGKNYLQMKMIKENNKINYKFALKGDRKLIITFKPVFPAAAKIKRITLNGNEIKYKTEIISSLTIPEIIFSIKKEVIIEIDYAGGIFVMPIINKPEPGDAAEGLRLISEHFNTNKYKITLEALSGTHHSIDLMIKNLKPKNVVNGSIITKNNNIYTLEVDFKKRPNKYLKKEIVVEF